MRSDPQARQPPVLTCSALTGDGLDDVWSAVLEHRAWLEKNGSLASRRAEQQVSWLWALVEGELTDALHQSPSVRALRASLEREVASGDLSAVEASQKVITALAGDLPGLVQRQTV